MYQRKNQAKNNTNKFFHRNLVGGSGNKESEFRGIFELGGVYFVVVVDG